MNTTTRRFPRSTLEAWPDRHPYCVEHYRSDRVAFGDVLGLVVVVLMSALIGVAWVL